MFGTDLATLSPLKKRAMSWSDDCHGNPRARTTDSSSTVSLRELQQKITRNVAETNNKLEVPVLV